MLLANAALKVVALKTRKLSLYFIKAFNIYATVINFRGKSNWRGTADKR